MKFEDYFKFYFHDLFPFSDVRVLQGAETKLSKHEKKEKAVHKRQLELGRSRDITKYPNSYLTFADMRCLCTRIWKVSPRLLLLQLLLRMS